jgi:CubicO group peptidase (beta-lactamase class C family)
MRLGSVSLLAFVAIALLAPTSAAARRSPDFAALERVVRDELKTTHTPGAAVAVIAGGELVYTRGFGVASVETRAPVTPSTLFRLGSTTKMLTGAAMLVLADQGRIDLVAPIGAGVTGLAPALARLTAHQLLSNTAGVADFAAPFVSHDDDALATMIRGWTDDALFGEPGRVYSYASPGFWLAGHVIERVGGQPYADMMDALVFTPVGMTRTTLRPLAAMTHPLAVGHDARGGPPTVIRPAFDNVAMWPAGSVYSSAEDLARFVGALLASGRIDGRQALPPALFTKLSGEYVAMPGEPGVHYGYGLLSFLQGGVRMVMHGGFSRGYGSMIQIAPGHGFAVIVVTNRSGETLPRTTEAARRMFLAVTDDAKPTRTASPLAPGEFRRFVGVYANGPQTWEIREQGGRLLLLADGAEVTLTKTGEWRLSFGDALANDVAFVAGPDGRAEYVFTGLYAGRRRAAGKP